ncbi:MAG: SsrA-binding protein SmpB [Chlorobi bacterium]|nr:SsrA-binding protein SmpB [Chlorobiota bacterium]
MFENKINIRNKKASFLYEFIEKFTAGIVLTGTEIKSIRMGKANVADSYCFFRDHELWVRNMHIAEYDWGTYTNHDPYRERKLLLTRRELKRLEKKVNEKGLTIVVTRLFLNDKGLAKIEIALSRGKKEYDRREDIKRRDNKRNLDRLMKR